MIGARTDPATVGEAARRKARLAGVLYLATVVTGFANVFIQDGMIVRGDAAASMNHVLAAEPLFRLGILAELVGGACYIGVTVLLYEILKPVNRTLSLMAAFFSVAGSAIGAVGAGFLMVPFLLLDGDLHALTAFTPGQLQALGMTAVRLEARIYDIGIMHFGVYCTLIGILMYRSGFMPRLLGALVVFAGMGWLVDSFAMVLDPRVSLALSPYGMIPGSIGEISLMLWLLFVGVNGPKWEIRSAAAAVPA